MDRGKIFRERIFDVEGKLSDLIYVSFMNAEEWNMHNPHGSEDNLFPRIVYLKDSESILVPCIKTDSEGTKSVMNEAIYYKKDKNRHNLVFTPDYLNSGK